MKRITVLVLIAAMVLSFACCNRESKEEADFNDENKIIQTPETTEPATTEPETEYRTEISVEKLAEAVYSYRYQIQDSGFSIKVGEVLDRCCDDFTADYSPYQETKNEYISSEHINQIENGTFKDYLNNSYIVRISGTILYNPEIPYYYSDYQHIITLLLHFDENDNFVGSGYRSISDEFDRCAIMLSVGSINF